MSVYLGFQLLMLQRGVVGKGEKRSVDDVAYIDFAWRGEGRLSASRVSYLVGMSSTDLDDTDEACLYPCFTTVQTW